MADEEEVAGRDAVRVLHDLPHRRGQRGHVGHGLPVRRRAAGSPLSARPLVISVGDPVGEDRAEHAGADGAAEAAEEGQHGGRGAQFVRGHVVLRGEHEVLHQHADADAHERHVDAQQTEVGVGVDGARAGRGPPVMTTAPAIR